MYRTSTYFWSKSAADFPIQTLQNIVLAFVVYFLTGLNTESILKFIWFNVLVILTTQAAISLAFAVSALSSSQTMAMTIFPAILLPFTVLSGFLVVSDSIPVYFSWLAAISFVKYGFSGAAINEFDGLEFTCTQDELIGGECPVCYSIHEAYNYRLPLVNKC